MNPFRMNKTLKSYTYPIIKIIIGIFVIVLLCNRGQMYHIENPYIDTIERIVCVAVGIACILCIYISGAEILQTHENRHRAEDPCRRGTAAGKDYDFTQIIELAKSNDIIDIKVIANGKVVAVGSSADCKNGSSVFFDKRYYVGEEEFVSIEEFRAALSRCCRDEKISVFSIDGIQLIKQKNRRSTDES